MRKTIIRMQKLKSPVAVRRSLKHAFREQETPNADPERTPDNTHLGAKDSAEAMQRFNAALPDKVRKNAVFAVEFLISASPEAMNGKDRKAQDDYFDDALLWLVQKHGAANVVYAGIHRDESTPHMYVYVVPKDNQGKLNCRSFYGERDALSKMQTDFADKVGIKHGLERGLQGSKARHTEIRQYYARVHAATPLTPTIQVPEGKLLESKAVYGQRVAESVIGQVTPEWKSVQAKARQTDLALEQAKVAEQGRKDAELRFTQRENQLRIDREKLKIERESVQKDKEQIKVWADTIVKGGEPLTKLRADLTERQERNKRQH